MLTYRQAKKFYDSFGAKQDKQFYEKAAVRQLIQYAKFDEAGFIVEFGCGTASLASRLLNTVLSDDCRYIGIDISETMIALCNENLKHYQDRASCVSSKGKPEINLPDKAADRFVSNYVLDLLSDSDASALINEAYRVLVTGGYLCLASLTNGNTFGSRMIARAWKALYRLRPTLVGGCRPVKLTTYLDSGQWRVIHNSVVVSYAVPSEVLIAQKR